MNETKKYYLGTGMEFEKAQCKEYKTLDGALKAAAKDESLVVWDDDGKMIGSLTDDIPDGVIVEGEEEQKTTHDDEKQGIDSEKETKGTDELSTQENSENEPNTASEEEVEKKTGDNRPEEGNSGGITNEQVERFNITVSCEGSIRLRRSPSFTENNECGRASKGQRYIGKRLFMVDGLPMAETIDGLFLSAAAEHVIIDKTE